MNNYEPTNHTARLPLEMDEHRIWFDGKKINEVLFCEKFLREHPMLCVHDAFFTTEGRVSDETMLKKEILDRIKPYITSGVARQRASSCERWMACGG